jgi:Helix-turn-helix domain
MKPARMQLKSATGWFAAGREVDEALRLLSDSAFRLFLWICLHAQRSTGSIHVNTAQLARLLGKSPPDIVRDLEELVRVRVCEVANDQIVIQDRFWPYQRQSANTDAASTYVAAIKRAFLGHACVVSAFTAADEKLAGDWQRRGIPAEMVERAILLGVARKYTTCLNHGVPGPITSLEYFAGVLSEIQHLPASSDYWAYLAHKVKKLQAEYRGHGQPASTGSTETK